MALTRRIRVSSTVGGKTATGTVYITWDFVSSSTPTTFTISSTTVSVSDITYNGSDSAARAAVSDALAAEVYKAHSLVFGGNTVATIWAMYINNTYTWPGSASVNKTTTAQTVTLALQSSGTVYDSRTITVPALESFVIGYDANSGSGAPGGQVKYYGQALQLSYTRPVKDGYTFKGWALSTSAAGAGTVDYAPGDYYYGDAPLTLYAVWELNYRPPIIAQLSVERCLQDGTLDDEGKYAKVSFKWSVFRTSATRYYGGSSAPYASNSVSSCVVTVGSSSVTPTLSGVYGEESITVGSNAFDNDTQYSASVSITDSQTIVSDKTATLTGTLAPTYFPMDFNADASAVGFFMPAPDNNEGAFFGKDVFLPLDTTTGASAKDAALYNAIPLGWRNDVIV